MPPTEPETDLDRRLTLSEHLEELRARVIRGLLALAVGVVVCLLFQHTLVGIAIRPHVRTMEANGLPSSLTVLSYTESFSAHLMVTMIGACFLAAPYMLFQLWLFIRAGLYRTERQYVTRYIPATLGLFAAGVSFGYFVLIPVALGFLISYGSDIVSPSITMQDYLTFFFLLTFAVGVVFELPLFMVFFVRAGILRAEQYATYRRHWILAAFIIGAVFTPPDPLSQTLLAVPLLGLYEVGIWMCRRVERRRDQEPARLSPS